MRNKFVTLLLCIFLGYLGIHRFYLGKTLSGILYLCTGGFFVIGVIVDVILILIGAMRDADGNELM